MNLTLIDRIIIMFGILPSTGNIQKILDIKNIKSKVSLTKDEEALGVVFDRDSNGLPYVKYLSPEAQSYSSDIDLSLDEINLIKDNCILMDKNNRITEFNLDTILKFINFTGLEVL